MGPKHRSGSSYKLLSFYKYYAIFKRMIIDAIGGGGGLSGFHNNTRDEYTNMDITTCFIFQFSELFVLGGCCKKG